MVGRMTRYRVLELACLVALVLVPVDARADGTATVPLARFEQLLAASAPRASAESPATYGVVAHRVNAVEDGPQLRVTLQLDVDVYDAGALIPLVPSGSVAVAGCTVQGAPAPLLVHDGAVATRIASRGPARIELLIVPTGRVAAGHSISMTLFPRPVTTLRLVRQRDDLRLTIEPAVELRGEGSLEGVLPPSDAVVFRWEKRVDGVSDEAQRIEANVEHTVEVREGGIQGRAAFEVVVEGQPIAELTLELPGTVQGVRVQGPAVRGSKQTGGEVRVQFAYPVTGRQELELRYDLGDASAASFRVPDVSLPAARRLRGNLVVVADPEVEVLPAGPLRGYQAADVADLGAGRSIPSGTVVFVYSFYEQPLDVGFSVRRHARVPVLASAGERVRARTVVTADGKAVTTFALQVTNNDRQFLRVDVPEGAETWSAFVDGAAVRPAMDDAGRLVVPIPKSRRAQGQSQSYPVEMTWMWQVASPTGPYGAESYALPQLDIVTTDIQWEIYVPQRYRYFDFGGTLEPGRETAAPLTFDDDETEGLRSAGHRAPPSEFPLEVEKNLEESRDKDRTDNGFLPVRLGVPATGHRLVFQRPLAGASEPLAMSMRYYDRDYIVAAEWLALFGFFVFLLAVFGHLLLAIRHMKFVRGPRWFWAGTAGLFVFGVLQGLLPIAFPAWWSVVLLAMGAGLLYGTVVFWAAIIGLSRSLWARFGGSVIRHARSVVSSPDAGDDDV